MITRSTMIMVRSELDKAIKEIGDKHGLLLETGNGRFSPTNATLKITMATKNASGIIQTPERVAFTDAWTCRKMGADTSWLDRKFIDGGYSYTVIGLNTKAKKYPINVVRSDGKKFKYPAGTIRNRLERINA